MKTLFVFLFLTATSAVFAQSSSYELVINKTSFQIGDTLSFDLKVSKEMKLEVSVFSDTQVLDYSNDILRSGEYTYRISTQNASIGKYYVLITGEGIHEQREIELVR